MCFAPQWRALFRHLNFQKWPEHVGALYILTWKCAWRHNCAQFFISHLARWLRTRRFSEPTFRPSGATNHWKNTVIRDFPTFSRTCIFSLLLFSLLLFSSLWLFPSLLSSVHIVGSLTSKLPSINALHDNVGGARSMAHVLVQAHWWSVGLTMTRPADGPLMHQHKCMNALLTDRYTNADAYAAWSRVCSGFVRGWFDMVLKQ